MAKLTRRSTLMLLGAGGGLVGLGYLLRAVLDPTEADTAPGAGGTGSGMMGSGPMGSGMMGSGMMGSATPADMSIYMEMFNRHNEIRRDVEDIPGGVRTVTESDAPDLALQLHTHVSSMYSHLEQGAEVTCMSQSLPTLFRHATGYDRRITFTAKGVVAEETATDPAITAAIRQHAREVSGFVRDGMPAMMHQMMR